ncbi:MAG: hypothetical protein K5866_09000 [Treponema sp.]|nr:hypothetical protein [Treponema sp.]
MNLYYLGQALNLSTLYMVGSLAAIFAIKSGFFNLGGEGQVYLGGFVTALLLNQFTKLPPLLAIPLAFLITFLSGACLGLISSGLKNLKGTDPLFTSFILSCAIIPLIDGAIAGPFRTSRGNLLATDFIANKFRFASIMPPSNFNWLIFPILLLCLLTYFFFEASSLGRKITISGIAPKFSQYAAFNNSKILDFSFTISAGLYSLCGGIAVCGTYYTCHSGFYSGLGWNGLSVALIACLNPILLIPASLFMGFLITYSNKYALLTNLGFDLSSLLQGLILFIISFPIFKIRLNSNKRRGL